MSDAMDEAIGLADRGAGDRPLTALILDDQEVDRMRLRHLCR